ncbi:MAG TPA: hypothetical protein VHN37_07645, partial [Actinomycetota bacterium]|nr:hypothetical protein [Actinomycetota bacterium]
RASRVRAYRAGCVRAPRDPGALGAARGGLARAPGNRAAEAAAQLGPFTWAQATAGGLALLALVPSLPAGTAEPAPRPRAAAEASGGERGPVDRRSAPRLDAGFASRPAGTSAPVASPAGDPPAHEPAAGRDLPDLKDVTDGNHRVRRPEDASIVSMAWAPEPSGGGRGFAIADPHCGFAACPQVLFTTADAGATWQRLPARGFAGHTLAIPPGSDGTKLFAMSPAGLQVSTDGGRTFAMAVATGAPLTGSLAVSPAFDRGDPTMLIGAQTLLRYDDTRSTIRPEPSASLNGPLEPVFAPAYPADPRFLVGGVTVENGYAQSRVFSCRSRAMCTWSDLHDGRGAPKIRLRPDYAESEVGYAFTDNRLYRSDAVWGFQPVPTPWGGHATLRDLALYGPGDVVFAAIDSVADGAEGLYRSADGGATWARVRSRLFSDGAVAIAISGRRMLVALGGTGLACSSDAGVTWARRCRP